MRHPLTAQEITPDPNKVNAIVNMPRPVDKKRSRMTFRLCNVSVTFSPKTFGGGEPTEATYGEGRNICFAY